MSDIITQLLTHAFAVWRRRGIAITVAWAVAMAGWAVVSLMPDKFRSQAVVNVDTASVLEPLLRGLTVDLDREAEIGLMQKTLLSRPNIEKVVRDTDLDLSTKTESDSERLIQNLTGRIDVQRQGRDLFAISFEDENPQLAHDVVQSLLTIFVENNLGQSRGDMDAARRFIEDQIVVYETKLSEAERKIAEFHQKNVGQLPGAGSERRSFDATQDRLEQLESTLREAQLRRRSLNAELKAIPRFFASQSSGSGPPTDTAIQILTAQKLLDDLMASYTEKHPDVVVAKRRLETLFEQQNKEIEAVANSAPPGDDQVTEETGISNPVYEQIKLQVVEQDAKIAALKDRVASARAELEKSKAQASRRPELEVELVRLNRDYEILTASYNQLLASRETEQISRARDNQAESIRFHVVEQPVVPAIPYGPNRPLFLALVLVVSLGSGVGFVVLLALSSETFSNAAELRAVLGIPVLGSISTAAGSNRGALVHGKSIVFWAMILTLFATFAALWFIESRLGLNEIVSGEILSRLPRSLLQRLPTF